MERVFGFMFGFMLMAAVIAGLNKEIMGAIGCGVLATLWLIGGIRECKEENNV